MRIRINSVLLTIYSLYIFSFITISCSQFANIKLLNTAGTLIQRGCLLILLLLIIRDILKKKMIKKMVLWVAILVCVLIVVFKSNNGILDLITVFIFAFSLKNISFHKIIKVDIRVRSIACALIILLSLAGLIDSNVTYSNRGIWRTSLGFNHPNTLSLIIMSLCFQWFYLRFYKLKILEYISMILILYILYFTTNSLTSIIGISGLLIFNLLTRICEKINFGSLFLSTSLFLVLPSAFVLSIYLAINYSIFDPFMVALNDISTGRVASMNNFYNEYGISLFGQPIELISTTRASQLGISTKVLDNGYMRLLLRFGLLITTILFILIMKLSYQLLKKKEYALVSCLSTYFIVGLMESSFYRIEYNIFLLPIVYVFMKKEVYYSLEVNNKVAEHRQKFKLLMEK